MSKMGKNNFQTLASWDFQEKNKVVWVRLTDFIYPKNALYLPKKY
jgi:hypothetical protein